MRTRDTHSCIHSAVLLTALSAGAAWAQPCPVDCQPASRITICYEAGRPDAYAAPYDSTSRRPVFDAFMLANYPGIIKQFDDPTENRVLGHTFQNLPCGIIAATLQVEMRAGASITNNDAIYLQYMGGVSLAWGSPIANLPGAGGTWNPGQSGVFTLNLASLPGGTNLLPVMNATHALDFLMQDDTAVESMRLTITVCPCDGKTRTYTVGIADNLAPPPEPTSRRPRLTAIRNIPPFLWKDTDDCTFDRGWGHTFQGITPGVVRAGFGIRMAPCGASNNDGLSFDLINDGGPELFSRGFNINLLPGTGGVWNTNPLTNFTFNLGATTPTNVCGTNLLGNFGDRTFDVYVQDDTAVDAARMRVQPCPPLRHIFGVPVAKRSEAELNLNAIERRWEVRNIGSSGQDGVTFDIRAAREGFFDIAAAPMQEWRIGSFFDIFFDIIDADGDGEDDRVPGLHVVKTGSAVGPAMECSIEDPSGTYTGSFTITLSSDQTGQSVTLPIDMGQVVQIGSTHPTGLAVCNVARCDEDDCPEYSILTDLMFDGDVPIRVSGQVFMGNRIRYRGWDGLCYGRHCGGAIARVDWRFSAETETGTPAVFAFGGVTVGPSWKKGGGGGGGGTAIEGKCYSIEADPDGTLDTNPGSLTLSNIGSTGNDGVEIVFPPLDEWSIAMDVICAGLPENCPPDSPMSLSIAFTGSINDQPGRDAGSSTVSRFRPAFFDIFYDVALGGSNGAALVKVFDADGNVAGMFPAPAIGALTVEGEGVPSGCGKQAVEMGGFRTACLWWDWNRDVFFGFPGLPPIRGRQVRILAGEPTQNFDYIERVRLTAAHVQELDLHSERVIAHGSGGGCDPCPADYNRDGGIDGADVEAFYADWENGTGCGDTNQDGGIDGADVEFFFAAWEGGGC